MGVYTDADPYPDEKLLTLKERLERQLAYLVDEINQQEALRQMYQGDESYRRFLNNVQDISVKMMHIVKDMR